MECHVYCFWPIEKRLNRALCNNIYYYIVINIFLLISKENNCAIYSIILKEKFEDTKGIIKICKSRKDRQCNG